MGQYAHIPIIKIYAGNFPYINNKSFGIKTDITPNCKSLL